MMHQIRKISWLFLIMLSLLVAACSETQATVTPPPEFRGVEIDGVVWLDNCMLEDGNPGQNCIETEDGYIGNGEFEDGEPPIGGVEVKLGQGACPSEGLSTTLTAESGLYQFSVLEPGIYCVSIDEQSGPNAEIFGPGRWTAPRIDEAQFTIEGQAGEIITDVNFGWDPDESLAQATE